MGRKKSKAKPRSWIDRYLDAARAHGEAIDPDMEVGDLQVLLAAAWKLLTPLARQKLEGDPEFNDVIRTHEDKWSQEVG